MKNEEREDGWQLRDWCTDLNLMIILLSSILAVDNIIFFPFIAILLQNEKPSLKYVIEGYLCIHSGIRIQSVDNVSIRYWHNRMQRVLCVKYLG